MTKRVFRVIFESKKGDLKMRKTHNKDFKFKVALEAIRGDLTIAQIVSKYQVAESFK